jgi:hypothetical protein
LPTFPPERITWLNKRKRSTIGAFSMSQVSQAVMGKRFAPPLTHDRLGDE